MVAMPSDNGASARVTQRIPVSVRHPATNTLAISDSASMGATTHFSHAASQVVPVNNHDTSSQPNDAMNHALSWPLWMVTRSVALPTSHQTAKTTSAPGTAAGTPAMVVRR